MDKEILCICGRKGVGKDTLTEQIIKNEVQEYLHLKVSGMLKKVCSIIFGQSDERFEKQELKEEVLEEYEGKTPREIMQFVGTEILQRKMQELLPEMGKVLQIRSLIKQIRESQITHIIISDIRFIHEIEELRKEFKNVVLVKIIREEERDRTSPGIEFVPYPRFMDHPSEKEVDMLQEDILIRNNKKKEDLYEKYKEQKRRTRNG